jgi:hypothetical protein
MALEVRQGLALQGGEERVAEVVLEVARGADDHAAHQEPEHPAHSRQQEERHGIEPDLVHGQPTAEVVDRVLQHPRPGHREGGRHHDTREAGHESAAITGQIADQAALRGHVRSIPAHLQRTGRQADRRTMRLRCPAIALLGVLTAANADAQFRVADPAPGENFHVELGLMFWTPTPEIRVQTGGLTALGQPEVDFVQEFGIESTRFTEFRAVLKTGRKHKLRVSRVPIVFDEQAVLSRTITFGGQTFPVSVPATAHLEWEIWRVGWEWGVMTGDRGVVAFVTELQLNKVLAELAATGFGTEVTEVSAPVPTIGIVARAYPHRLFSITAEFSGFKFPGFIGNRIDDAIGDDFDAKVFGLDLYGTLSFGRHVGVQGGYRRVTADYVFDDDAGDLKMQGMYFGGLVRF